MAGTTRVAASGSPSRRPFSRLRAGSAGTDSVASIGRPGPPGAGAITVIAIVLLSFLAALLGSSGQATVGFGFALAVSPVLLVLLEPAEAVLCTLICATSLSLLMVWRERSWFSYDRGVTIGLVAPAVPGVVVGAALLEIVDGSVLQLAVGLIVLAFVALQLRWRSSGSPPARRFGFRRTALLAGFSGGVLNGSVSTGGPPLAIWLHGAGANPDQTRHTLALVFLVMNSATIAVLLAVVEPTISADGRAAVIAALLGIPVGYSLGRRALNRLSAATYTRAFLVMLAAVGAAGAANGAAGI